MHRRAAIRAQILTALGGLTGVTVAVGKVYPETVPSLPAINVVTGDETVDPEAQATGYPPGLPGKWVDERSCEYEIECRATATDELVLDDAVDALVLQAETALNANRNLSGAATDWAYVGSSGESTGDLEQPVGLRTLLYRAIYRVDARDPQALEP